MSLVPPFPAALAGIAIFLVPGLLFLSLLRREERDAVSLDEALFLTVAVSVGASAWVALLLAEARRFSLTHAGALIAIASLAVALFARRRPGWPYRAPSRWTALGPALLVLALALVLQARPSQYIVGGRDPGTYVAAMAVIARTGGIVYTDPVVLSIPPEDVELFYRNPDNPPFSWARFMGFDLESPKDGRVFPQFFHLFPAFGAYLFQAMGVKGALATPPVLGVLGTLAVFFAVRRLLGPGTALLGTVLLALNVVQVWFARYPVSEGLSQLLVFLAVLALAHWEERRGAAFGALAGVALGLSLLVRIDSALMVVPVALYVLIRRARHDLPWREARAFLVPFVLLAMHAGLHAILFARKYLLDIATRRYWSYPAWFWLLATAFLLAAILLAHRLGPRLLALTEGHGEALRAALVAAVVALALYAYFLRPLLSAWAGADGNDPARALAESGWLEALGFRRLAAHDAQSFVRLGWFVSPLGLLLGVLGLVQLLREWRPRTMFLILLSVAFSLFYFYKVRVWNDYFFALRRFVPVVLPALFAFAGSFLWRLGVRGGWRRVVATALGAFLLLSYARDTWRIARHVDWGGSVRFVDDVARRFGPDDLLIFEQRASIHLLSLPLWAAYGVNILELARFNPDPDRLHHLFRAWRGRYRNIYFVHTYRTDLCGVFLQRVEDYAFGTTEWERSYDRPPRAPEGRALRFTVSRVVPPEELQVPALDTVDIGGSDDFQVSGFFDKEGGGEHTFRWTGACASVYLPGAQPEGRLVVRASVGRRPPTSPAVVKASLSGVPLGAFTAGPTWQEHALDLPDPLPPGPPVLRLDVPAWRPLNLEPGSQDTRDLGIMVDLVRIEGGRRHAPAAGGAHAKIPVSARAGGGA